MPSSSCSQPPPPFIGSIALVRRFSGDREEWLGLWNVAASVWQFVQAMRGDGETYRSCLDAEIRCQLGLEDRDFLVGGLSRAHYQAPVEWPDEEHPQWVLVQFFPVELYGSAARQKVERLSGARWFTMREVALGRSSEGEPISERQRILFERAGILPADALSA